MKLTANVETEWLVFGIADRGLSLRRVVFPLSFQRTVTKLFRFHPALCLCLGSGPNGVGQNIAMHALPTARNFSLSNFYLPGRFDFIFSKSSL